ncbi:aconitate hydratase AcnA [Thermoplasmatales archaeon AK]|nr:aconitate hydratase AcnA [Thermoplasmatales archaeon AK]
MASKFQKLSKLKVEGTDYYYYSLMELAKEGYNLQRLPVSIRILLESLIRNIDGKSVHEADVERLLNWNPQNPGDWEVPFKVSRVIMQDFTGIPAVVDLAAMREAAKSLGKSTEIIQPQIPVDLVIDHSVQVDYYGIPEALSLNRQKEFERNTERYRFLKWAQSSFKNLRIVPPSVGIIHQVNLEYLAQVVMKKEAEGKTFLYPDSLVGTDSHTTMIGGIGVVGWGVGGIEAEAAMLDQPVTFKVPEVVGVRLTGKMKPGVTATDVVLSITELLRKSKVVEKFVEFFGDGVKNLAPPDRATISNMCPEYGATIALFPVDDNTMEYLEMTGRAPEHLRIVKEYLKKQGLFGVQEGVEYSQVIDFDLSKVKPSVSGPKLPQQRVDLERISDSFISFMEESGSFTKSKSGAVQVSLKSVPVSVKGQNMTLGDGDVVIAAITSCTNTSNPQVMIGAGLLAKKAVELGLKVNPKVKTSLAPGSRVVSDYLQKSGLQEYLDKLGFNIVGFGCTTCIGNSGPLDPAIESAITQNSLSTAAVLSGNRNFEARIHRNVRANYLMSPPLVVAFAIAGKVTVNLEKEPLGTGRNGQPVYLRDIWPSDAEIQQTIAKYLSKEMFTEKYRNLDSYNEEWNKLSAPSGSTYNWEEESTYIRKPPFFDSFDLKTDMTPKIIKDAYPLIVLGDSVTTDHISPAGSIGKDSPAGKYLIQHGVSPQDFNSYGARRGNHEVMMRGTFANNRIKNKLLQHEGGYTLHFPDRTEMSVYDAAMKYAEERRPLLVIAGDQYGTGSSRDWAAKGTLLLGVKGVIAVGYERIHRSNLVGMGVIPLEFNGSDSFESLNIDPAMPMTVTFDQGIEPEASALFSFTEKLSGKKREVRLAIRVDTPIEVEYVKAGGILQYVLRKIIQNT